MIANKAFDVEHALSMYATSFILFPAESIYDQEIVERFAKGLETCHVYMIGLAPRIELVGAMVDGGRLTTTYEVAGQVHELQWSIPSGGTIESEDDGWCVITPEGGRFFPSPEVTAQRLNEQNALGFEVLYIGQAYGKAGSRNALDRLLKHETLQRIAIQGVPPGHGLSVLLLEIQPSNTMITVFNPHAKNEDKGEERISKGLDKLFNTDEAERITLYEASLIRYFQPKFNKEFKNSFPSTNMKVLADCYDKDFSAVIAEICIDELPFKMFTKTVLPLQYHIAKHDLHDEAERQFFFFR